MEVLGDYGDTDSEDEQPRNTASPSSGLAVGQIPTSGGSTLSRGNERALGGSTAPPAPQPGDTIKLPSAADLFAGKGLDRARSL
ncbi:hypothetical protein WJX75_002400 [Coccomyxa subellipsoidea]|uniref:Uncharacterized protein n=1 Tax=Coccomyxa subellipsoidea TaxID=248742 RepID=A0ABR2Z2S6_9CHLO